jgi:hypothetical protein
VGAHGAGLEAMEAETAMLERNGAATAIVCRMRRNVHTGLSVKLVNVLGRFSEAQSVRGALMMPDTGSVLEPPQQFD